MPCPPLFPEARQRAFQPLAKSRRRFAVTAAGGEQRFLIEHAQPSHHLGSGGHQVALDRGILRGPLVGGFRRSPQLLAPPGARLAQRAALVRRDAQRPGELASNSAAREKTLMSAHCAASSASAGTGSARAANA